MTAPPVDDRKLYHLVRWRIRDWAPDPHFEDFVSEALILAWKCYCQKVAEGLPEDRALAMAVGTARFGRRHWLAKWLGKNTAGTGIAQRPPNLPLSAVPERATAGFEAALLGRIDGQRLWAEAAPLCTARQRQILARVLLHGESWAECGRALGVHRNSVQATFNYAIRRVRERVGPEALG